MESPPSTNYADRAEETMPRHATASSDHIDESFTSKSRGQDPTSNKRTSFLDLPGELRNQIYVSALEYDNIRNLKLKHKFSSNGSTYVREHYPPLYHALPQLRKEILSIYYSESKFRVHLWTAEQRDVFRAWISHRGKSLDGLKHLELVFINRRWRHELGYHHSTATFLLTFDADGELSISRITPFPEICPCWVIPLVERAFKHCASKSQVVPRSTVLNEPKATSDASSLNPVLTFALKFCALRDLKRESQPDWSRILHDLNNEGRHTGLEPYWWD